MSRGDDPEDRGSVERAIRKLQSETEAEAGSSFLFHRFSPALQRQFIRWGASAAEAPDLNQQAFQRIFQDVGSFQGGDRLFESWIGWMWQIARTTWLRDLRSRRALKRPQNPRPLEAIDDPREASVARPPGQLDRVLVREAERQVREAIAELPEKERKCVILYYYQGLTTRQAGVILRIAQGTVKAHLSHARAKLKAKLGDRLEPGETGGPARFGRPDV